MDGPSGSGQQQQAVSQFPRPPMEYIEWYTPEAVASGSVPPPPAPIEGHYYMFGQSLNTNDPLIQSLESQGIKQLYSSTADNRGELKRLTRSLVAAYLDLVEILIRCPESPERQKKLEDIRLLFFNTHHLINEYRPQQARETVQLMVDIQQRDREAIIQKFATILQSTMEKLQKCAADLKSFDRALPDDLQREIAACLGETVDNAGTSTTRNKESKLNVDEMDAAMCGICDMA